MFDKFGEFNTCEELNRAAAAQKAEGDEEAVIALAEENGLDQEDAEDYLYDEVPELATHLMAAYGKLKIEEQELVSYGIMMDWMQYIRIRCQENDAMAVAVRRKDKHLKECIAQLLKWSFENAQPVDIGVLQAAGVPKQHYGNVKLGIPDMGKAKEIITAYYLGQQA